MTRQDKKQIVIVKVEMTGMRPTGRNVMRDLNWFPEFEPAAEAKACMWLHRGTDDDVRKAAAAMSPEYTVYTFPASDRDPLGKAKAAALADYQPAVSL